ncbi:hypothetical protein FRC16_010957, partial [Serendipita sp. 398]
MSWLFAIKGGASREQGGILQAEQRYVLGSTLLAQSFNGRMSFHSPIKAVTRTLSATVLLLYPHPPSPMTTNMPTLDEM